MSERWREEEGMSDGAGAGAREQARGMREEQTRRTLAEVLEEGGRETSACSLGAIIVAHLAS